MPGAAVAQLSWSGPLAIDSGHDLTSVACASATQCTAVDTGGGEVTVDPQDIGSPTRTVIDPGVQLNGVACVSATQCTAVDNNAAEVTFDPQSPGAATPNPIDSGGPSMVAVACPSATQCTAVGGNYGREVMFNPQSAAVLLQTFTAASLIAIACPSVTQCTAAGTIGTNNPAGVAWTFNPQSGDGGVYTVINPSEGGPAEVGVPGVACPSTTECTALRTGPADSSAAAATFDPQTSLGTPTANPIDTTGQLNAVACLSATDCVVVDSGGNTAEGDPTSGSAFTVQQIPGAGSLDSVSCVPSSPCVAVDGGGNAFVGSPAPPGSPPPPSSPPPPPPTASALRPTASVTRIRTRHATLMARIRCVGGAGVRCRLTLTLTSTGRRKVRLGARNGSVVAGQSRTLRVTLNRRGKRLLVKRHRLKVTLTVTQRGHRRPILKRPVRFRARPIRRSRS